MRCDIPKHPWDVKILMMKASHYVFRTFEVYDILKMCFLGRSYHRMSQSEYPYDIAIIMTFCDADMLGTFSIRMF